MNRKEKALQYKDFIASEKFTNASYSVLKVFRENIDRMVNLAELHIIVLKRIESGDMKYDFSDPSILKMKQLVLVDMLCKIMIMIESLLALFDAFSRRSKREIPSVMIRYRQPSIDRFIQLFQHGKVNIRKLAGLPNLMFLKRNCALNQEEISLVHEILEGSCRYVRQKIASVIKFYNSNRIIYGKFKHGLLFQSGFSPQDLSPDAPRDLSLFFAFDKQARKPSRICFEGKVPPKEFEWFNTYSILPCSDLSIEKYAEIMKAIRELSDYILANHLLWAYNCGEDYLPVKKINKELFTNIPTTRRLTKGESELFNGIVGKVSKNIHFPPMKFEAIFNFSQEKWHKIEKCFSRDQCATIWHPLMSNNAH